MVNRSAGRPPVFYTTTGEKLRINDSGSITKNDYLCIGQNDDYPDLRLGSANGNNLGIATNASGFSSSSAAGGMVLRSLNRLLLQSGGNAYAIIIDTDNYVNINNRLNIAGTANIYNGSPQGFANMQSGSLIIDGTYAYYGGSYCTVGSWTGTNTAGLLIECAENTEIVVHDDLL